MKLAKATTPSSTCQVCAYGMQSASVYNGILLPNFQFSDFFQPVCDSVMALSCLSPPTSPCCAEEALSPVVSTRYTIDIVVRVLYTSCCLLQQNQTASVLDKRTSAAVESLLSLRAGTPVREENCSQWRPPSPAASVVSSSSNREHSSLSPMQVAREEVVDSSADVEPNLPNFSNSSVVSTSCRYIN